MTVQPKRNLTKYVIAVVLVLIIVAGVGYYLAQAPTPTTSTMQSTSTVAPTSSALKDTIIIGTTDSIPTSLDPASAYDYFGDNLIQQIGSPLVDIRPGSLAGPNDFVPALATDWTASPDGLTYTFNLRQGVKASDGTCCFNATVVKYHFDRGISIADPDGAFVNIGYGDIIKDVEVTSTYQVVFHLKAPFAPLLSLLTFGPSYPVNPVYAPMNTLINYTSGDARQSTPMDYGPYVLSSWTRVGGKDTQIKLDANPYYWNASGGYPKTQHIVLTFYSDATTLKLAAQAGEVDVAFRQLRPNDISDLQNDTSIKVWQGSGAFIQYLVFQENTKPFDDVRVRSAIAAAIDRQAIVNTVFRGQATPLYSLIPIGMFSHQDVFMSYGNANYSYTVNTLAPLGYDTAHKLTVDLWYESSGHYQSSPDIAAVLKSSLEASGVIAVNLHGVDYATYKANTRAKSMPMYIYGFYPDYVDPDDYAYPLLHSTGASWVHDGYANPMMDQAIEGARSSVVADQRLSLYQQVQQISATDVPMVPLFQGSSVAVSKPSVGGIVLDISQVFRYYLIYEPNQ